MRFSPAIIAAGLCLCVSTSVIAGSPDKTPVVPISQSAWTQPLVGTGIKTNDEYTDGNVFLTLPLWSTIGQDGKLGGNYLFIEPYTSVGDGGEVASSLGLSWRHLFSDEPVSALKKTGMAGLMEEGWFLGGSFFVDMMDTAHRNSFWQLGVGLEAGTRYFEVRGNYYIPLTGQKLAQRNVSERSFSSSSTQYSTTGGGTGDPFATGNQIVQNLDQRTLATTTTRTTTVRTITEIFEKGMEGWDIDAALLVPWLDQWMDVKVIGGYFSFDNQPFGPQSFGTGNVHGWKAGLEVRPVPAVVLTGTWYEDKRLTGDNWTVGAQLQIPLDSTWKDAFKFRRRHLVEHLAEPVHRQNDAVKIGNKKEENSTSSTSVHRVTRVVSQGPGRIVLADDVVFVNNGPDVGNGIQGGGNDANPGTAEQPKLTVQGGANLAQTNSNSTSRVWNVYTQGTAAGYTENVTADVGSVNFIGSGKLIQGQGGKTFGKGVAPVVNGGFYADNIPFFGITAYTVNGGASAGHSLGDIIHVHVPDGGTVNIIENTLNLASLDAIYLNAPAGPTQSNITIRGNTIDSPLGYGIHLDTDKDALVNLTVANNTLIDTGDDSIAIHHASSLPLTASFTGNTISGSFNDGINIEAEQPGTTMNLTFTGNSFLSNDGDGVDFDTVADNVKWNFLFSGNTFTNNGDENLDLKLETNSGQVLVGNILNNTFTGSFFDNLYIWLDSGAAGARSSYTGTISGNTFTDSGDNAIHIDADGTGAAPNNTLINATISGNTFHNALGNYIATHAYGTSDVTVAQTGNDFHSAVGDAIQAVGLDNAVLNFTATNNTISNQNQHGIHFVLEDSASGTATITGNTLTSTFDTAIFVENTGTGAATMDATINNNTINGADIGIYVDTLNGRTSNLTVSGNNVSNTNHSAIILQNSVSGGTGSSTLHVIALDNNTIDTTTDSQSSGIISQTGRTSTTIFDSISNNVVKNTGSSGMNFLSQGLAGTNVTLTKVDGNTVTNVGGVGIYANAAGGDNVDGAHLTASITNNTITASKSDGVRLVTNDNSGSGAAKLTATVTGNTISGMVNSFANGINVISNGDTSTAVNLNSVSNNTISGLPTSGAGIKLTAAGGTIGLIGPKTVNSNTITNTATSGDGIDFISTGTGFINLNGGTVNNNTITGVKQNGILFSAPNGANPSGVLNGTVSGNQINLGDPGFGSTAVGIFVQSNAGGSITSLNINTNTITSSVGGRGILLNNASSSASELSVIVNNNTITGMSVGGVLVSEGAGDGFPVRVLTATITNNNITMAGTSSAGISFIFNSAVTTATSVANLTVSGNTVSGTTTDGFYFGGDSSNLATLNVFNFNSNTVNSGYTGDGISVDGTINPALTNINGTISNSIAAPAGGFNRLKVNTGAGTVTGTIIINSPTPGSVNLNTTPVVP